MRAFSNTRNVYAAANCEAQRSCSRLLYVLIARFFIPALDVITEKLGISEGTCVRKQRAAN